MVLRLAGARARRLPFGMADIAVPVLLVLGLATRLAAFGLLMMTMVIPLTMAR